MRVAFALPARATTPVQWLCPASPAAVSSRAECVRCVWLRSRPDVWLVPVGVLRVSVSRECGCVPCGAGWGGLLSGVADTRAVLSGIACHVPVLYRPPYGATSDAIRAAMTAQGYRSVVYAACSCLHPLRLPAPFRITRRLLLA